MIQMLMSFPYLDLENSFWPAVCPSVSKCQPSHFQPPFSASCGSKKACSSPDEIPILGTKEGTGRLFSIQYRYQLTNSPNCSPLISYHTSRENLSIKTAYHYFPFVS